MGFDKLVNIEDVLKTTISYQENAWSSLSKPITITECIDNIRSGKYKSQVNRLQSYLSNDQLELYTEEKKRLPAVTFSADFNGKRNRDSIKNYTQLLVIDIDKLSQIQKNILKDQFQYDDHILTFWESPSKAGIKGLISLEYGPGFPNDDYNRKHTYAFKIVSKYFSERYSTELDNSGSDIPRLCFFSFDEHLFIRDSFKPFPIKFDEVDFGKSTSPKKLSSLYAAEASENKKYNLFKKNHPQRRFQIYSIIKFLTKGNKSITKTYKQWYQVAYAIANTFTYDIGHKYYLSLCELDGVKYDEKQSISMLNYCYENTNGYFTFGTVVYFAKAVGYKEKKEVPKVEVEL